ncbi:MAG: saccharopine dehydrogenase NADP-binding domain-containing protein [Armatimonadetes bacterium]|nr:saccharopine dehydrogenase NADP-binding domain-containing protein [Armatimonadota bacterium]
MRKTILVLGAGLVAKPLVQYLLNQREFKVIVASRTLEKARKLIGNAPNGEAHAMDVADTESLSSAIAGVDLVISLVPYIHHVTSARLCVRHKKHLVTTSYVSDAMRTLDEDAMKAGVLFLNEIGLDPGIDHMSAMKIIHRIQASGGKVTEFHSYCGGLPAPEANTNPFGYKFSWSPRGVVLAGRNNARYLEHGKIIEIPGKDLFDHYWSLHINGIGNFEAYPNRDSLSYIDLYGLKGILTMFRGTLRNMGWCRTWKKMADLGLLDDAKKHDFTQKTYHQLLGELVRSKGADVRGDLAAYLGLDTRSDVIERIEWLGLLDERTPEMKEGSALDLLVEVLIEKLKYRNGERDMIILRHEFEGEYPDRKEKITSTLVDYGIPNSDSAMSRTVGLPAAIASRMILEGKIPVTGVHIPILPEIYEPVLAELEGHGIRFAETAEETIYGDKLHH